MSCSAFLLEVVGDDLGVCQGRLQVGSPVCCLRARVARRKAELKASRQVVDKVRVGVMREQGCQGANVDGGNDEGWWWWVVGWEGDGEDGLRLFSGRSRGVRSGRLGGCHRSRRQSRRVPAGSPSLRISLG